MSKLSRYIILVLMMNAIGLTGKSQVPVASAPYSMDGPWKFISQDELHAMGLKNHDATMPIIRLAGNRYWIYLSEGGKTDGKHSHIIRVRATLEGIDTGNYEDVPVAGIPDAAINEYNGWKAWMMNLHEIDSDEWLAVLHFEDQDAATREAYRLGLAYSDDEGRSFKFLGFILETDLPDGIIKRSSKGNINIAGSGIRRDQTYLYVYFSDMNTPDRSDRHLAVARANRDLVIERARKGKNASWHKYYRGEWNEPGLGGHSSSLGTLGEYHTTLMYNNHIKRWILFNVKGGAITMRRSPDPLSFDVADEVLYEIPRGGRVAYCSIQPHQEDMTTCGREFYIYYRYWFKNMGRTIYDTYRLKVRF